MAVTRRPNAIEHTANGDASSGRFIVSRLVWNGSSAAADDLIIKNGAGTVELSLKAGSNTGSLVLEDPFGPCRTIDGIETDTIDNGTVEYILQ
jgi:hypothetical protein